MREIMSSNQPQQNDLENLNINEQKVKKISLYDLMFKLSRAEEQLFQNEKYLQQFAKQTSSTKNREQLILNIQNNIENINNTITRLKVIIGAAKVDCKLQMHDRTFSYLELETNLTSLNRQLLLYKNLNLSPIDDTLELFEKIEPIIFKLENSKDIISSGLEKAKHMFMVDWIE